MSSNENDVLRNIGIGSVASIPYIGGTLAYIMDKKVPEEINLRYTSFVSALENDIKSLKKEIAYSRFETPEFYSMFVKVLNEVISNHIEDKRTIYKNILINTAINSSWHCDKNAFFFSITIKLSLDALDYLFLRYSGITKNSEDLSLGKLIEKFMPQRDYLTTVITELIRYRLIKSSELTEFGKQYCNYIFTPISFIY